MITQAPLFYWLWFAFATSAVVLSSSTAAASSSSRAPRRALSSRRTTTEDRFLTGTIAAASQPRTACPLYVWNAPSALLHRWCQHLMKDQIIEGRGGVKFVRIEPGSILQLLYPCSRYSPDSCLFCGGTFVDHMTLAWSKHLYTPYDAYLDWMKEKGTVVAEMDVKKQRRRRSHTAAQGVRPAPPIQHAFHRLYLQDDEEQAIRRTSRARRRRVQQNDDEGQPIYRQIGPVRYRIPFQQITLLRAIVMVGVESLIRLENHENELGRYRSQKEHDDSCC